MSLETDEALLKSVKLKLENGSPLAECQELEYLYSRYSKKILNYIYKFTFDPNVSNDLLQETFIKIITNIRKFKENMKFSTWLYRIATNTALDHLKKIKHKSTDTLDNLSDIKSQPLEDKIFEEDLKKNIKKIIEQLPFRPRTVFILKFYEGLKNREIAEILSCSERNVKKTLFKWSPVLKKNLIKFIQ